LIKASRSETDLTVGSLFVNPTQFNNPEDFRLYPTQPEKDISLLSTAGCDVLFMPETKEIYPEGTKVLHSYPLGYLETIMEGKFRPGHFQGVCQVVDRLLNIVNPDTLFLGQKDWQQCKVIEKLLILTGRSETTKLVICPTKRELNGLAMSSRNQRLHEEDRNKASMIYKGMIELKETLGKSSFDQERRSIIQQLENNGFSVEYLELVDSNTLEILHEWDNKRPLSLCIAAFLSNVRLIDNMILHTVH
jgi:pantoate--beta-alanine ligase